MSSKTPILLLVDSNNCLRKNLYAQKPLKYEGNFTQAVKGMHTKVKELIRELKPTHMALCYDVKGKTFRHELYEEYKGTRDRDDSDKLPHHKEKVFHWQCAASITLYTALGWPILLKKGMEADDWIGSAATQFIKRYPDGKVYIWSGDKDFSALVNEQITHLYPQMMGPGIPSQLLWLDKKGVRKKFRVKPKQMVEYLAMMGDTVDNIPGIAGVGPKTAQSLLAKYGSIQGIKENKAKLAPGVRAKFKACKKLDLWVQLVQIKCDLKLSISKLKLDRAQEQSKEAKKALKSLGFNGRFG